MIVLAWRSIPGCVRVSLLAILGGILWMFDEAPRSHICNSPVENGTPHSQQPANSRDWCAA